jgi:hypothetical protein
MELLTASMMLAVAAPVLAQGPSAVAPTEAGEAAVGRPTPDPERLAAAERVVDRLWPIGTYRRILASTMPTDDGVAEATSSDILDWEPSSNSKEARRAQHEARTGRPLLHQSEEDEAAARAAANMAELNASIAGLFDQVEPRIREALALVYARRYTLSELNELDAFFSTPTGSRYAADSLTLMNDPEMMAVMASLMDETVATVAPRAADAAAEAAAAAVAGAAADAAAATATSTANKF